ncbi:hypothetical protein EELLY_v1c01260 [Entomoplasma ellychniae]|uniref:DUF3800 domain-containing protein n=1 Tax=Entomoplasma ellychniae TaxID=2114 RepID=A0A8E2QVI3_9MOLU|nr:DUF3800 domain-containing protein [Entomoplasma ellychniae]PPE04451.1 hypothetical protein EELLY_v1c01260 [Entomoplasma ellychniae]
MKKYISFYLDESGSPSSTFFTVGGFFVYSTVYSTINSIKLKIKSNILKTEKSIKEFRKDVEIFKDQFLIGNDDVIHKEVKWSRLTTDNKEFLLHNLKNFGQQSISITSNLKKWISRDGKKANIDLVYNIMVSYLIEIALISLRVDNNEDIDIKVFIDQRKLTPNIKKQKDLKLESLEGYISTTWFKEQKFVNSKIKIVQLDSYTNPTIRYSDYYAGLINSMCRFLSINHSKEWDNKIDQMFEKAHRKFKCKCLSTIKNQCDIIELLVTECVLKQIEDFEWNINK